MTRSQPCPACGREIAKRPRSAKLRYRHKCPHGQWCSQGDPLWGAHSNGRSKCPPCNALRRAAEAAR